VIALIMFGPKFTRVAVQRLGLPMYFQKLGRTVVEGVIHRDYPVSEAAIESFRWLSNYAGVAVTVAGIIRPLLRLIPRPAPNRSTEVAVVFIHCFVILANYVRVLMFSSFSRNVSHPFTVSGAGIIGEHVWRFFHQQYLFASYFQSGLPPFSIIYNT
jgi:hypothetical protein